MKILTRYILSEFFGPFILSLAGFSVLILVIQVFNDIKIILEFKPGFLLTLKYFTLQIPELLVKIIPIAILMAVLFSLSRLSKHSELIAMRAGGVSISLVAIPLFFTGLAVCLFSIFLNEAVVPKTAMMVRHAKVVEIQHQPEQTASQIRQNISMIGAENLVYHIGSFNGVSQTMNDILILEFDRSNHLKSRLDAQSAHYEDGRWVFSNGYLRAFDESDTEISAQAFNRFPMTLAEKPGDFLKEQKEPQELGLAELTAYIRQLKTNGSDYHKELVELNKKIAVPFGCVILAILGVPWGWTMNKYSGVVFSFGVCLLVAFFYIGGMEVGHQLGDSGVLSPFISMWIMNLLFGILGPWLLIRNNR